MSAEEVFLHNEDEKKIQYFMNNLDVFLTEDEFQLAKLKRAGKPIVEIKSRLNLTTSSYYKLTKNIEMKVKTYMAM
jgi:DNA-binding CsgD family transcriptional regulator